MITANVIAVLSYSSSYFSVYDIRFVEASGGIQRARNIAYVQAELAIEAVQRLESSEERDALVSFAAKIVDRTH